ncbi:MAG: AAA family ATPase [Candidatus Binatia bacterium]
MTRTITLCSGKGGVGKTVFATCLARIIQQEEHGTVLLIDLDPSVQGLTLLLFQNKYELDHVPLSFADYLRGKDTVDRELFEALHRAVTGDGLAGPLHALYRRMENIFAIPFSTDSEFPQWEQFIHLDFELVSNKLQNLITYATESCHIDYIILDTQAGPNSLSLVAATLSDINLIVLEEDDISWRTALNMLLEISDLNKRLQRRSRSYFLANKASTDLIETAGKLRAFSFLSPLPYDAWMQKLFAKATSAALEKEFENTDFFRQARSRVWQDIATLFGVAKPQTKESFGLSSWFRKQSEKPAALADGQKNGVAASSSDHKREPETTAGKKDKEAAEPEKAKETTKDAAKETASTPAEAQSATPTASSSGKSSGQRDGKR